jgi:hypothetical protein
MKIKTESLEPSALEIATAASLALGVVLLANTRQLLAYYNLESSDQFVRNSAGNVVEAALKAIDSLRATNGVVTFLIWAVVGVVCFGIVEAIASAIAEFRLESELSTRRYVHPAAFTKVKFWRGILFNSLTLFIGMILLATVILEFVVFVLPLGLVYSRPFLYNFTLSSLLDILLGVILIFVGLLIVNVCIRFLLWRRRVFSL